MTYFYIPLFSIITVFRYGFNYNILLSIPISILVYIIMVIYLMAKKKLKYVNSIMDKTYVLPMIENGTSKVVVKLLDISCMRIRNQNYDTFKLEMKVKVVLVIANLLSRYLPDSGIEIPLEEDFDNDLKAIANRNKGFKERRKRSSSPEENKNN